MNPAARAGGLPNSSEARGNSSSRVSMMPGKGPVVGSASEDSQAKKSVKELEKKLKDMESKSKKENEFYEDALQKRFD